VTDERMCIDLDGACGDLVDEQYRDVQRIASGGTTRWSITREPVARVPPTRDVALAREAAQRDERAQSAGLRSEHRLDHGPA
jgi:hypothetical protein